MGSPLFTSSSMRLRCPTLRVRSPGLFVVPLADAHRCTLCSVNLIRHDHSGPSSSVCLVLALCLILRWLKLVFSFVPPDDRVHPPSFACRLLPSQSIFSHRFGIVSFLLLPCAPDSSRHVMEAMYPLLIIVLYSFSVRTPMYITAISSCPSSSFPLRLALLSSWTWASLSIIAIVVIRFILIFNASCNKQRQLC